MDRSDGAPPSMVRPYTLTAGRTVPVVDLPIEASVQALPAARARRWQLGDVRAQIVALCEQRPSVAEIAGRCDLPLGVARVLVGDLVGAGLLQVEATLADTATVEQRRELIGRTLRGLRALR